MNTNDLIKYVNLNGYSKSKGFIGFSERNQQFSFDISRRVISFFLSHFKGQLHKFKVVTSLHFSDNFEDLKNDYDTSQEQYGLLLKLNKAGWLNIVNYSKFGVDYDSDEYQEQIESLYTTFSEHEISNQNINSFEQLLTVVFSIDGVDGHCFLISEDLGIIVYPHEDTGFGVIYFKGKKSEELSRQFLLASGKIDGIMSKIL